MKNFDIEIEKLTNEELKCRISDDCYIPVIFLKKDMPFMSNTYKITVVDDTHFAVQIEPQRSDVQLEISDFVLVHNYNGAYLCNWDDFIIEKAMLKNYNKYASFLNDALEFDTSFEETVSALEYMSILVK